MIKPIFTIWNLFLPEVFIFPGIIASAKNKRTGSRLFSY